jgi:hypothetical protein
MIVDPVAGVTSGDRHTQRMLQRTPLERGIDAGLGDGTGEVQMYSVVFGVETHGRRSRSPACIVSTAGKRPFPRRQTVQSPFTQALVHLPLWLPPR